MRISQRSEPAQLARRLLQDAHDACYKANTSILGMSSGPFSGVNQVLGIIAELDETRHKQTVALQNMRQQMRELEPQGFDN